MSKIQHLKAGWLGDLPQAFADQFLDLGTWVHVPAGQLVYSIGAAEQDIYGIAQGVIRMHIAMNEHEQRLAHMCGPGFWFGDMELVTNSPRIMEIDAAEDLHLIRIRQSDVEKLSATYPQVWRWIAALVVQHAGLAISAADDLMLPSAEKRLVAVLLRLAGHRFAHPASPPLGSISITQQELAVAANLSRSSASTVLKQLRQAGEIRIDYRAITLLDPEGLTKRLAENGGD